MPFAQDVVLRLERLEDIQRNVEQSKQPPGLEEEQDGQRLGRRWYLIVSEGEIL